MPLTTKRKTTAAHRKRQALHHRRGKQYTKAYLPYLPMLAIVAGGGIVNEVWTVGSGVALAAPGNTALSNSRLAVLTGDHSYTPVYIVLAVTFLAFSLLLLSHWYRVHRLLNRGEAFMVSHPWFDIGLVLFITVGVLLTRV